MYKRRFIAPLHPVARAQTTTANSSGTVAGGQQGDSGKENGLTADDQAVKKPKRFNPPAIPANPASGCGVAGPAVPASVKLANTGELQIFSILYCKREKFRKTKGKGYQDGIIELRADCKSATLLDTAGKVVTKGKAKLPAELQSGAVVELGNFCCEIDQQVPLEDFKRGICFADLSTAPDPCGNSCSALPKVPSATGFKPVARLPQGSSANALQQQTALTTAAHAAIRTCSTGLFDPTAQGAVVLNDMQWRRGEGTLAKGRPVVPVVVDPYVGRNLRPHQQEGVVFMYECVMGLKSPEHKGCILADEMGLGKTLQVLTLLWTLLRQGPEGVPVVQKAVVVAPATLVDNWAKEVKKWLGQERVCFIKLTNGPSAIEEANNFKHGSVWKLLIASYEAMRKYGPQLAGSCDLLVCDEGHRLKAKGGNKTIDSLLALNCQRRVVLTGTPVQNNLDEFYALLSFAVPGLLGTFSAFKCVYGDTITRSRDKDATADEKELGAVRAEELHKRVSAYMLRRTQDVLSQHLPPLSVHTLFCKPSQLQVDVYRSLLRSKRIASLLYSVGSDGTSEGVLPAITVLRKLCNHPKLLMLEGAQQPAQQSAQPGDLRTAELAACLLQQHLPAVVTPVDSIELSGKLHTLSTLLSGILAEGCKVVVVSTSTSALDLIDALLCAPRSWRSVRVDGSTSVDERQNIVDNFNTRGIGQVFLLSTRAGGAGLNLIGANHLVLFDGDWNPAADLQAMSRIWRDGQKKPCFVTRLVTAGTIEEKVYQRQMMKSDLADATMHGGNNVSRLSHEELRQLFCLDTGAECSTRRLLDSSNAGNNLVWLPLQDATVPHSSLPTVLVEAASSGVVTAINRECKQHSTEVCTQCVGDSRLQHPTTAASSSLAAAGTAEGHTECLKGDAAELEIDDD